MIQALRGKDKYMVLYGKPEDELTARYFEFGRNVALFVNALLMQGGLHVEVHEWNAGDYRLVRNFSKR